MLKAYNVKWTNFRRVEKIDWRVEPVVDEAQESCVELNKRLHDPVIHVSRVLQHVTYIAI